MSARPLRYVSWIAAPAALALAAGVWLPTPPASGRVTGEVLEGRELFVDSCASCHGAEGQGGELGPSIQGAGEAGADFQLRTGRMPLADPDAQAVRKPPAFSPQEIDDLVAYVASLGEGPGIPVLDPSSGALATGQELFVANCAPCHGTTGNGGAVGEGALAPSLSRSNPLDVVEAIVSGPGEMPRFDFSEEERGSIIRFTKYLQSTRQPGGADIGGVGPVPEGYVAWALGTMAVVAICLFIGRRRAREEPRS